MAQYYKSSPEIEQKKKKLVLTAVRKFKSQLDESSCATNVNTQLCGTVCCMVINLCSSDIFIALTEILCPYADF